MIYMLFLLWNWHCERGVPHCVLTAQPCSPARLQTIEQCNDGPHLMVALTEKLIASVLASYVNHLGVLIR
jgi:hypothetical protein